MSLPLELKQQIFEEVLLDLNHNEISTAERSTNLEDHYRTFRLQAHALSLVPGFTFANEWAKKKQTSLQILYATLHDLDVTFRYNSITGAMYVNYPYPPLYPPFPSDEPLHLIIELRSDDDWGFPLDNILWWHHRVLQDVQQVHVVMIQRQPQCYKIGPKFKRDVEDWLWVYLYRTAELNAHWTELQFELRCHGQSAKFRYERRDHSTSSASVTYPWLLVEEKDWFDKNEHLNLDDKGTAAFRGLWEGCTVGLAVGLAVGLPVLAVLYSCGYL